MIVKKIALLLIMRRGALLLRERWMCTRGNGGGNAALRLIAEYSSGEREVCPGAEF